MIIFIVFLALFALALEWFSLTDGLKHVTFDCESEVRRTEPGAPFDVTVRAGNTGRVPISYLCADVHCPSALRTPEGEDLSSFEAVFRLWGRRRAERHVRAMIEKRGVHRFRGASLLRGDFLGLSEADGEVELEREVIVFPKRCEEERLTETLGNYCGDLTAQRWLLHDPILTLGVREYTGREPMHTISWTQSARRGEWMVREFDYTRELSCTIVLALNGLTADGGDLLDRCCSIVRTVTETMCAQGVNVALHTNGFLLGYTFRSVWSCEAGRAGIDDVLDTLARLYGPAQCSARELADTCVRAGEEVAYIVVAPRATREIDDIVSTLGLHSRMSVLLLTAEEVVEQDAEEERT